MSIEKLRSEIDATDAQLVALLAKRMSLAVEIGRVKSETGQKVADPVREAEVLGRIRGLARQDGLDEGIAEAVFRHLIKLSCDVQEVQSTPSGETVVGSQQAGGAGARIAIVGGAGKMGRWIARHLTAAGRQVVILDRDEMGLGEVKRLIGVEATTNPGIITEVDVLVLAVPVLGFEEVLQLLAPFTRPGQIVFDITSVKTVPVSLMHQYLPHCTILGTHPMFGPGADGVRGHNVALTPTNASEKALADHLGAILTGYGANVVQMTPAEHDELIAVVLGLAHFIALVTGDALLSLGNLAQVLSVSGTTFRALFAVVEGVLREDPALYGAIQMGLPALPGLERRFIAAAETWADLVAKGDASGFRGKMTELRRQLDAQLQMPV